MLENSFSSPCSWTTTRTTLEKRSNYNIIQLIFSKFSCFVYLFNNFSKIWRNPSSTRAVSPDWLFSIKQSKRIKRTSPNLQALGFWDLCYLCYLSDDWFVSLAINMQKLRVFCSQNTEIITTNALNSLEISYSESELANAPLELGNKPPLHISIFDGPLFKKVFWAFLPS